MGVTKADCFLLLLLYFIKQSRVLPRSCACPHSAPSQRGQWNIPMAVECHQGVAGTRTSLRSPTRGAFHVWGAAPSLLTEPLSAHGFSALCWCSCQTHLRGGETEAATASTELSPAQSHPLGPVWSSPCVLMSLSMSLGFILPGHGAAVF